MQHHADPIPPQLWTRIREFVAARRTGNIRLDVKEGSVLAWQITETGRIHPVCRELKEEY